MPHLDEDLLRHASQTPYDAVKAHEYYIRTRKLKGRQAGTAIQPSTRSSGSSTFSVRLPNGRMVKLSQQQLAEQRAYAAKRVEEIKQSLQKLSVELKKAMKKAKEKKAKSERDADKPKTAAEKRDAAKESKQYRDKHKQSLATKRHRSASKDKTSKKSDPVSELEDKISVIKERLTVAVARQRALTTAIKNQ
jgi:hypothetical protein